MDQQLSLLFGKWQLGQGQEVDCLGKSVNNSENVEKQ